MLKEAKEKGPEEISAPPLFTKLDGVITSAATPSEVFFNNIRKNVKRDLPRFHHLPDFKKVKLFEQAIILVGGGPSINDEDTNAELKEYALKYPIVACGSSHDWLISQGIVPTYCTVCDPDAIAANYLTKPQKETIYLIATSCDEAVFKTLEGYQIYMWHCLSPDFVEKIVDIEPDFQAAAGGCTVGLRSIVLSIMLGYSNIHFFGFDSCIRGNQHHAYDFTDETETLGQIYPMKIGLGDVPEDRIYYCAGYQLAQAKHFHDFYTAYCQLFRPTFHGDGLLPAFINIVHKHAEKLQKELDKTSMIMVNS